MTYNPGEDLTEQFQLNQLWHSHNPALILSLRGESTQLGMMQDGEQGILERFSEGERPALHGWSRMEKT